MNRLMLYVVGFGLGFAIALAAIAAVALAAIGVGGHVLAVREPGLGRVLGFDPSQVARRATIPGVAALVLLVVYVVIASRIGRPGRTR